MLRRKLHHSLFSPVLLIHSTAMIARFSTAVNRRHSIDMNNSVEKDSCVRNPTVRHLRSDFVTIHTNEVHRPSPPRVLLRLNSRCTTSVPHSVKQDALYDGEHGCF